mmetsp:Transcript_65812/g.182363  ORF Transcript_65812/g.182363 Transcript_65812/m.182363 type:complete len:209 (+) Transcript_65812:271-897(+)
MSCLACRSAMGVLLKSRPGSARCNNQTKVSGLVSWCNKRASCEDQRGIPAGLAAPNASAMMATATATSPLVRSNKSRAVMRSTPTHRKSNAKTARSGSVREARGWPGHRTQREALSASASPEASNLRRVRSSTDRCKRPTASASKHCDANARHRSRPFTASSLSSSVRPPTAPVAKEKTATPKKSSEALLDEMAPCHPFKTSCADASL